MATLSRRQVLLGGVAATLLSPVGGVAGRAFGDAAVDPAARKRRRLVVVWQNGGNDGLNLVVPAGDVPGAARRSVYQRVRPSIALPASSLLPLDLPRDRDQRLGLHGSMSFVHGLYRQGRVAVVQGVDYPQHDYSHFRSSDIWQSGEPGRSPSSGWLGRHLDRVGTGDGELRGLTVGRTDPPLVLQGRRRNGTGLVSIGATRFSDGEGQVPDARHRALELYGDHDPADVLAASSGAVSRSTVKVVRTLSRAKAPGATGNAFSDAMLTARVLLEQDLGTEVVFVQQGAYDTHTNQLQAQAQQLDELDAGLEAFYTGTRRGTATGVGPLASDLSARTVVMVYSEFGRRIGEAGGASVAGTDHGAAAPVLLVGPAGGPLVGGLHGDHPAMGTPTLPADNLEMTTDLRRVYASLTGDWLRAPDPLYDRPGPLPGLFR